jgi:methionyl-tRNA synthetase
VADNPKTFYLTTPIYYPNARPHVGSAYTTIVCDVLARYKRMCGYDVAFLTGTDEHGEKLQRAAAEVGKSAGEFVAEKRQLFIQLWKKLGISPVVYPYENLGPEAMRFIYTDHRDHFKSVRRMLLRARANKVDGQEIIYKKRYEGRYCIFDEMYVAEGSDPIDCPNCGRPAELISEENYFFRLSAFRDRLLKHYEDHPEFVQPDFRMNEVKNFVKDLRDISISRKRIKWGIPFPLDEEHDDPEQVFYVWYDALVAYMTGIGYAEGENGSATFQKYWRNSPPDSELVHMVGKDILRFHAVYWPAFIMAAYPDQPEMLPTTIFAHGWIYYEQDKMSKSKGNVVYPEPIVDALDSFGAPGNDALRYYLLRGGSPKFRKGASSRDNVETEPIRGGGFGHDTSFSYDDLIERYISDLANDLGNLANRTLTLLHSRLGGRVRKPARSRTIASEAETHALASGLALTEVVVRRLNRLDFSGALDVIWHHISNENRYFTAAHPWANDDVDEVAAVLCHASETLRKVAVLTYPILPVAAKRLWRQLGEQRPIEGLNPDDPLSWEEFPEGAVVGKPEPIFPRLDKAKTLAKLEELAEADRERDQPKGATIVVPSETSQTAAAGVQQSPVVQADSSSPAAPQNDKQPAAVNQQPATGNQQPATAKITIDDFAKVEMVVGQIISAEAIPGAKKLLKLQVDIGTEVRQVAAGIAEYYRPEELAGMKIVLVANLEPRKLRGVESNGMVVAASIGPEGKPVLATFKEDVPNGTRLK